MILDNIQNYSVYLGTDAAVDTALRAARGLNKDIAVGRHEFANGVFCNVTRVVPKPVSEAVFETHKRYLDLQFVLEGKEHMLLATPENLTIKEGYNEQRDIAFYEGAGAEICVKEGSFYLVYPWDAHAPSLSRDGKEIKKAVFKIPFGG